MSEAFLSNLASELRKVQDDIRHGKVEQEVEMLDGCCYCRFIRRSKNQIEKDEWIEYHKGLEHCRCDVKEADLDAERFQRLEKDLPGIEALAREYQRFVEEGDDLQFEFEPVSSPHMCDETKAVPIGTHYCRFCGSTDCDCEYMEELAAERRRAAVEDETRLDQEIDRQRELETYVPPQLRQRSGEADKAEVRKYYREVCDQIKNTPRTRIERHETLRWRRGMLLSWLTLMGYVIQGVNGLSFQEETANAISTIGWTFGVLFLLYVFINMLRPFVVTLTHLVAGLGAVVIALLTTANVELAGAIWWWKATSAVKAGVGVASQCFAGLNFFSSLFGFKKKDKFILTNEAFKPQGWNKYGVLGTTIAATLMFVMVPMWGFAKSQRFWDPIMKMADRIPYVTWLVEWTMKYCAGETDTSSIPTSVREFAEGKEVEISPGLINPDTLVMKRGKAHMNGAELDLQHDDEDCYEESKVRGTCEAPAVCHCCCHIKDEVQQLNEIMGEAPQRVVKLNQTTAEASYGISAKKADPTIVMERSNCLVTEPVIDLPVDGVAGIGHPERKQAHELESLINKSQEELLLEKQRRYRAYMRECDHIRGAHSSWLCKKLVAESKEKMCKDPSSCDCSCHRFPDRIIEDELPIEKEARLKRSEKYHLGVGSPDDARPMEFKKSSDDSLGVKDSKGKEKEDKFVPEKPIIGEVIGSGGGISKAELSVANQGLFSWFGRRESPIVASNNESVEDDAPLLPMSPREEIRCASWWRRGYIWLSKCTPPEEGESKQDPSYWTRSRSWLIQKWVDHRERLDPVCEFVGPTVSAVKNHVEENKVAYLTAALAGATAVIGFIVLMTRGKEEVKGIPSVDALLHPECAHVSTCPTMPGTADSQHVCNTACGGTNCVHWVGCNPAELKVEGWVQDLLKVRPELAGKKIRHRHLMGKTGERSRFIKQRHQFKRTNTNRNFIPSGNAEVDFDNGEIREREEERAAEEMDRLAQEEDRRAEEGRRDLEKYLEERDIEQQRRLEEDAAQQYGRGRRDDRFTKDDFEEGMVLKEKPFKPCEQHEIVERALSLRAKHFPVRIPQKEVATRQRRRALAERDAKKWRETKKTINPQEYQRFINAVNKTDVTLLLKPEALLGKNKIVWQKFAQGVFKVKYGGMMTSTGTVVCDKLVVPLHSHVEGKDVLAENPSASAKVADLIPLPGMDLGVFMASGVKSPGWRMRPPKNEQVIQLGFTKQDQVEPEFGVGFCSAEGIYDAPTDNGDCGGPVIAVSDSALVGFHIAGGPLVNRFIPMTEKLAELLRANRSTLLALDFQ